MSFEEAYGRLEETVRTLEGGELTLAQMVAVYEEAVRLCGECTRLLDLAELRVSQLATGDDGEPVISAFDLSGSVSARGES
jgi:exodeoxyribonuclease VII small subunit